MISNLQQQQNKEEKPALSRVYVLIGEKTAVRSDRVLILVSCRTGTKLWGTRAGERALFILTVYLVYSASIYFCEIHSAKYSALTSLPSSFSTSV